MRMRSGLMLSTLFLALSNLTASADTPNVDVSEEYAKRYHQASDEVHAGWKLDGVVQDLQALYGVGKDLAVADTWPNWDDGNPFKAARDTMINAEPAKK